MWYCGVFNDECQRANYKMVLELKSIMRIAMIGQKGIPAAYGGVERHVEDLAVSLVSRGHDVTVYGRSWYARRIAPFYRGIRVVNLLSIHTKHLDTITHVFLATWHAIFSRVDVIHYHGVGPALLSWIPRIVAPRIRVVGTFHSIDRYHQKWGWFARVILRIGEWAVCRFPHVTIAVSAELKNYCLNEFGREAIYVPNGVEMQSYENSDEMLREFGIEKEKYIIMVSRLIPHKGAHVLAEAFDNLQKKGMATDLKLVIVGGAVHTEEYVASLRAATAHNTNIVFTGFLPSDKSRALLANCAVCVHPSVNEGLPISVLEAMAVARPVLLSSIPAHLEMISDSRIFFRENNVADLENKVADFIGWSADERTKLGVNNQAIIAEKYSLAHVTEEIEMIYSQLLVGRGDIRVETA